MGYGSGSGDEHKCDIYLGGNITIGKLPIEYR